MSALARELHLPVRSVERELERLVKAGIVERGIAYGITSHRTTRVEAYQRPYRANAACRVYVELRRIAMQDRGAASVLRPLIPDGPWLVWLAGAYALGRTLPTERLDLVIVGPYPKRLIRPLLEKAAAAVHRPVQPTVISSKEWVTRFDKHETVVRRLRAGPKLWLHGDGRGLRRLERDIRPGWETIRLAVEAGDDLTDEWDDDYDPDLPPGAW